MKFLIAGVLVLAMISLASSQTTNQKVSEAGDEQELKRLEDE
jgi:ketosteroid isomerase-like protein